MTGAEPKLAATGKNVSFRRCALGSAHGFTLLEVLVALSILGVAVTVLFQLFSTNLRTIALSGDYVLATVRAEAKMREVLDDDALGPKAWSETTSMRASARIRR